MTRAVALTNEILRGVVGSTAHGTAVDGQDDRDEMGVFIEPAVNVCGLHSLDHYIHRTQPEGVRSGHGDLDLTLYSLRKFCHLASKGNPSILMLLWLPEYITATSLGLELVQMRDSFHSRESGYRFLGYLTAQKMRLTGERSRNVSRPDLVERYGYDTKFAMHALRLAFQGIEYLQTGRITLPVPEPQLSALRAVRQGMVPYDMALAEITGAETRLAELAKECCTVADLIRINNFLVSAHRRHWCG